MARTYGSTGYSQKGISTKPLQPLVDDQPCPDADGPHALANSRSGQVSCLGCRRSWADLDAELRPHMGDA